MYRLAAIVLALLVGTQALASREAFMVCRYTGKVVDAPCPCPPKRNDEPARLERDDCCEIRKAEPIDALTALSPAGVSFDRGLFGEVELAVPQAQAARDDAPEPKSQSPPGRWRYLSLRQLLI